MLRSLVGSEMCIRDRDMPAEKEQLSKESERQILAVLQEAASHDSEAQEMFEVRTGARPRTQHSTTQASQNSAVLEDFAPVEGSVDAMLASEFQTSQPSPGEQSMEDSLLDLLGVPETANASRQQDPNDLLMFSDSPRMIGDEELLRHLGTQDSNDVFI
eukprot:TRINITY_DN20053_c0_g1_i1.p1 TRINITY_DN20053_c0_g1~~TRINITY_DN20053_c0_g1_i1.p1  ORF type:complete len:159 (-),score=46.25 TRINITY_DN20053_c0_g1_i1:80-556(-)